ncbi:uncharacterized protein LOC127749586 [Frankliniella occidentalis]|uniref:Uncharacterized protein LOC127749586 n=1 Tax=Frankliniella occidentalis TaxID=133901 RepID=A0A9C6U684_FRAOC|nr:uncharacterized protein LOC127749586 [Frankliniella occidentalis]
MAVGSPSRMTTMLLQAAYTSDRHLIGKSYAGQKKTIHNKVYQKPGIKRRRKVVAIQALVFKKHPTYTQSAFGQVINNYIAKLSSLPAHPNKVSFHYLSVQ